MMLISQANQRKTHTKTSELQKLEVPKKLNLQGSQLRAHQKQAARCAGSQRKEVKIMTTTKTTVYTYKIIKENYHTGERAKRSTTYYSNDPLSIGGLYFHLPGTKNGCYRVVELLKVEEYLC